MTRTGKFHTTMSFEKCTDSWVVQVWQKIWDNSHKKFYSAYCFQERLLKSNILTSTNRTYIKLFFFSWCVQHWIQFIINKTMEACQFCEKLEMKQMPENQTWEKNNMYLKQLDMVITLLIHLRLSDYSMHLGSLQKILPFYA